MTLFNKACCWGLVVLAGSSFASERSECAGMWSAEPAQHWTDGLVSGNGTMGILVLGDPENERIIFNHEACYEFIGTEDDVPPNLATEMPAVKKLLKEERYRDAAQHLVDTSEAAGWERAWTDPYHPALVMEIHQEITGSRKKYARRVNFETGEVDVQWSDERGAFSRKSFVSRPDQVVVQQISGTAPVSCSIQIADLFKQKKANTRQIKGGLRLKEPELQLEAGWMTVRVGYAVYSRGYEAAVKIMVKDGAVEVINDEMIISEASEVLLITRINFLEEFSASNLAETRKELESLGDHYQTLLDRHATVHGAMFKRVQLDLHEGTQKSNEEYIADQIQHKDRIDPAFLETVFNMGRYTLISSSGKLPPNLTGIWQGDFRPAWSGDLTLDANVNMQISGANIGNLKEAIDSYMNLLERIAPDWEINAKQFYGCEGYLSGIRTSGRRGLSNHYSVYGPWPFWTSGAEWLLLPAYEYYQVSGDEVFLKERLLPMMKKTVLFYENFLTEFDEHGNYLFVPSASPENTPSNSRDSCAAINSTIDIAAAKEAIQNLITVCQHLDIEQDGVLRWKAMLEKLPPYLVSHKGSLKEWATPLIGDNQSHRHISHLYPVWPGHEINPDDAPELFAAARKAIRLRQIGDGSGFGLAHRALICSRLKMDEEVFDNIRYLLTQGYFYSSLFTGHNVGPETYNADLINGFPAIIMESLVYSRPGMIELLPGWSPKMSKGSISGIKCRSQATVEKLEWDFKRMTVLATISSGKDQTLELRCKRGIANVVSPALYERISPNAISFKIKKNEVLRFELKMQPVVAVSPLDAELSIGKTRQLNWIVLPKKDQSNVRFVSSDPAIASVDEQGTVSALKEGRVDITALSDGGKTGVSSLTIHKPTAAARIKFKEEGAVVSQSQDGAELIVSCFYHAASGSVVHDCGIKYSLTELNARWGRVNEYIVYDKTAAGTGSGDSQAVFSMDTIPFTSALPKGHFYILAIALEDDRRQMTSVRKVKIKIEP